LSHASTNGVAAIRGVGNDVIDDSRLQPFEQRLGLRGIATRSGRHPQLQ
jgi:hypothetical protein